MVAVVLLQAIQFVAGVVLLCIGWIIAYKTNKAMAAQDAAKLQHWHELQGDDYDTRN